MHWNERLPCSEHIRSVWEAMSQTESWSLKSLLSTAIRFSFSNNFSLFGCQVTPVRSFHSSVCERLRESVSRISSLPKCCFPKFSSRPREAASFGSFRTRSQMWRPVPISCHQNFHVSTRQLFLCCIGEEEISVSGESQCCGRFLKVLSAVSAR